MIINYNNNSNNNYIKTPTTPSSPLSRLPSRDPKVLFSASPEMSEWDEMLRGDEEKPLVDKEKQKNKKNTSILTKHFFLFLTIIVSCFVFFCRENQPFCELLSSFFFIACMASSFGLSSFLL